MRSSDCANRGITCRAAWRCPSATHGPCPATISRPRTRCSRTGKRVGSDTQDWRVNAKIGYTPNATNEYTLNYTKQSGEKPAPSNVYNNPPVPPNSYWRWPWWDVQNTSLLTTTQLGAALYLKAKAYYNVYKNAHRCV